MNQLNMAEIFSVPSDYQIPQDNDLKKDTYYPNLNSKEYFKKSPDYTTRIQKYFEILTIYNGSAILCCNDYTNRIWNGSFWGFDDLQAIGKEEQAVFKLQCQSPITSLIFVQKNMILVAEASGSLQYWSTYSEVRDPVGYCLFMLGGQNEHVGIINAIDVFKQDIFKAISVANDGCIKLWDMGGGDLFSFNTWRYAHFGSINGISSSHSEQSQFVTCSADKSVLLWDHRQTYPAIGLYENHDCKFTTICWTSSEESKELIYVGDEKGDVNIIDSRKPNEFLHSLKIFDKSIHKLAFKGKHFAVCGDTNEVKALETTNFNQVFFNKKSQNYVRDVAWSSTAEESYLYTVDWDSKVKKHKVSF